MSSKNGEGPVWDSFFLSLDNDSESMISGEGSHRPHTPGHRSLMTPELSTTQSRPIIDRVDSVMPGESASHNGDDSYSDSLEPPSASPESSPFPFKFKTPSGRVHRLQVVASAGIAELIANVTAKLGAEIDSVGGEATFEDGKTGKSGYALSYLDNEGDTVSITTDQDLLDAIMMSRQSHRDKVDLFVHDPEKPPMSATLDPHPVIAKPLTPPPSALKERTRQLVEDDEEATPVKKERKPAAPRTKQDEQIVSGLPNELLLPGAIGLLAIVIVGVFAFSRSSNR